MEIEHPLAAESSTPGAVQASRARWVAAAFSLGFCSLATQTAGLREITSAFGGNELVLGVALTVWLVAGGLGSWAGSRTAPGPGLLALSFGASSAAALAPFMAVWAARDFVLPGLGLGLTQMALVSAMAFLLPGALLGGLFAALLPPAATAGLSAARVYAWEAAGALSGGLMILVAQLLAVPLLPAILPALLAQGLAGALVGGPGARGPRAVALVAAAAACTAGIGLHISETRRTSLPPGHNLVERAQSPYGTIEVTEAAGERSWRVDGVPLPAASDAAEREEIVHYAMAQAPGARRVALIGASAAAAAQEVLKYPGAEVDLIEIDPVLVRIARERMGFLLDERVHVHSLDPRGFFGRRQGPYDVIILGASDPLTLSANRLFTSEFFADARASLAAGGVISLALSGSETYLGERYRSLQTSVFRALREVFPETLVLPGRRTVMLGSDRPLTEFVVQAVEARGVPTQYVRREYLEGRFSPERLRMARAWVQAPVPTNRDSRPASLRFSLDAWLAQFGEAATTPLLLAIVVLAMALVLGLKVEDRPISVAIGTTGWVASAAEVAFLFAYQTAAGALCRDVGLLFASFMLGAAAGAALAGRWGLNLVRTEAGLVGFLLLGGGWMQVAPRLGLAGVPAVIASALWLFVSGALGGAEYAAVVARTRGASAAAGRLYAMDLVGAALGALLAGAWLIPRLGLTVTLLTLAAVKVVSASVVVLAPRAPAWVRRAPWAWVAGMVMLFGFAVVVVHPDWYVVLYRFSLDRPYPWAVGFFVLAGLAAALGVRPRLVWSPLWRGLQYIVFSLVVFFPVLRCWFRVPYVFCHACLRPCVFGLVRPYVVWGAAVMNLSAYPWCHHVCPVGLLLRAQPGFPAAPTRAAGRFRAGVFVFVVAAYFVGLYGRDAYERAGTIYHFFLRHSYAASAVVLAVAAGFLVANLRVRPSFCRLACPIGALMDVSRDALAQGKTLPSQRGDLQ